MALERVSSIKATSMWRGAALAAVVLLLSVQAFALTGTVKNDDGAPLSGVVVRLLLQGSTATSDAQGGFSILQGSAGIDKTSKFLIGPVASYGIDILGRHETTPERNRANPFAFAARFGAVPLDTLVLEKARYTTRKLAVLDWNANLGTIVMDTLATWPGEIGTYMPDAATTGPRPGVALRRVDEDVRITANGQIVENLDIYGRIVVTNTGKNAIVRNCIVRGPGGIEVWKTSTAAITGTTSSLLGLRVEDTRIDLTGRENPWVDGIRESDVSLLRVEITRTTDGISLVTRKGNVVVEGCWIHDGYYHEWTPGTANYPSISDARTHADAVQFHRGKNYVFRGNRFGGVRHPGSIQTMNPDTIAYKNSGDDYENSCFMIKQEVGPDSVERLDSALIEKNWIMGGASSINLSYNHGNTLKTFVIRDNVFPLSSWGKLPYILKDNAIESVFQNNKHPDGTTVPISKGR